MDPIFKKNIGIHHYSRPKRCVIYKKVDKADKKLDLDVDEKYLFFHFFNKYITPSEWPMMETQLPIDYTHLSYICILMSYLAYKDRTEIIFPPEIQILMENFVSDVGKIPFFILYDKNVDAIIVALRGSSCSDDFITDSMGEGVSYDGGKIHHGVFTTAIYVYNLIKDKLIELNQEYNGFDARDPSVAENEDNSSENEIENNNSSSRNKSNETKDNSCKNSKQNEKDNNHKENRSERKDETYDKRDNNKEQLKNVKEIKLKSNEAKDNSYQHGNSQQKENNHKENSSGRKDEAYDKKDNNKEQLKALKHKANNENQNDEKNSTSNDYSEKDDTKENFYHHTKIIITGHSLGAAVAAVVTYFFYKDIPKLNAKCICFAPPPTVSFNLWEITTQFVTSYMLEGDPVPFLSLQNIVKLTNRMFSKKGFKRITKYILKYLKKNAVESISQEDLNIKLYPPGQMFLIRFHGKDRSKKKSKNEFAISKLKIQRQYDNIMLFQIYNPDYFSSFIRNIRESNHSSKNYMKALIRLEKLFERMERFEMTNSV